MTKDEAEKLLDDILHAGSLRSDASAGKLAAAVNQLVMLEREACAQTAEGVAHEYEHDGPPVRWALDAVSEKIRARP